ncbi:MAG: hypothetical protein ACYC4I_02595 [Minisyncoccota bacterium]
MRYNRFLIGAILVLGIFVGVWRFYFPHAFERICWHPDEYAQSIHVVSLGSDRGGKIEPVATTTAANIYYCARFGALPQITPIPSSFPAPISVPGLQLPPGNVPQSTVFNDSVEVPVQMTISGASTTIEISGFSFTIPSSWKGEEYFNYGSEYSMLLQESSTTAGFTIDCPPIGKGAEEVVYLSTEKRTFVNNGIEYDISLSKMGAPKNDPWYWIFVTSRVSEKGTGCLITGSATPEITEAMRDLYESWK